MRPASTFRPASRLAAGRPHGVPVRGRLGVPQDGARRLPARHGGSHGARAARQGDRIGLLLDLDEGTLTVYKNGMRLGVISREMHGRFCWAAYWCPTYSMSAGETVRIVRKPVPEKNAAVLLS